MEIQHIKTVPLRKREIIFFLNGKKTTAIIPPGLTLLELLHKELKSFGTKSVCNEGDCGSCTVVIGKRTDNRVEYEAINSCLYPAVKIHNKHLITIEGIGTPDNLHPVQQAILDYHGTQCGYCTPGFVMAVLGLLLRNPNPEKEEILSSLEGNLCRCTGYQSILEAVLALRGKFSDKQSLLPEIVLQVEEEVVNSQAGTAVYQDSNKENLITTDYFTPKSLDELFELIAIDGLPADYAFVSGGTDLFVEANVQRRYHRCLIDISEVPEMTYIKENRNSLRIGGTTTLTKLQENPLINNFFPVLVKTIALIGSRQIRNLATLAGNIVNASPVADTVVTLLALNSEIELLSSTDCRTVKLEDFFLDYKKTVLRRGELIKQIVIPKPRGQFIYSDFIKSAKRRAADISSVNSAFLLSVEDEKVRTVRLAFGGVAACSHIAVKTMKFIKGKTLQADWFPEALDIVETEFKPISDVRGEEKYRRILIRNHTEKYLNSALESYSSSIGTGKE